VIVLLDENFPLGLLRSLQDDGLSAQHIITLGWRGASDARIRERLQDDQVVFLTREGQAPLRAHTDCLHYPELRISGTHAAENAVDPGSHSIRSPT
jgi:hypothetical protein